jgi:S-adenosylmethionine:tRNA ribosyltransferase-isomerase
VLRTTDLDYHLPPDLIAMRPAEPRDAARLLVVSRSDDSFVEHAHVRDLPRFLEPNDLLVLNNTHVVPAWIAGKRADTGGGITGLFLREAPPGPAAARRWLCLFKGGHLHPGVPMVLSRTAAGVTAAPSEQVSITLISRDDSEPGAWLVEVTSQSADTQTLLDRIGQTPIPPYIRKARKERHLDIPDTEDRTRYQTVFADPHTHDPASSPNSGSVAAPTAGLHFTRELLATLTASGIRRAETILHVGPGTFRPVETEFVEQHPMHGEWCSMSRQTLEAIRDCRDKEGRVFPVGTTAARTIESFAEIASTSPDDQLPPWLETRLLVTPGYPWQFTDGLLTNFHLPRSTLLAMVAALFPAGMERLRGIYQVAIGEKYRFYSYGDAMLILP